MSTTSLIQKRPSVNLTDLFAGAPDNLEWTDTFYDDDQQVYAVFDVNYALLMKRLKQSKWFALAAAVASVPITFLCAEPGSEDFQFGLLLGGGLLVAIFGGMWCRETKEEHVIFEPNMLQ